MRSELWACGAGFPLCLLPPPPSCFSSPVNRVGWVGLSPAAGWAGSEALSDTHLDSAPCSQAVWSVRREDCSRGCGALGAGGPLLPSVFEGLPGFCATVLSPRGGAPASSEDVPVLCSCAVASGDGPCREWMLRLMWSPTYA